MQRRLTHEDFAPEVMQLFDAYVHGRLDRRGFLEQAQTYAKAGMSAAGLLAALSPNFALGQVIKPDDARIKSERVTVDSPNGYGKINGLLVRPASAGTTKLPAVLVIHENRGLNPHIEDIARRLAVDGFMAFAPDALTPMGGYPGDEDKARDAFAKLEQPKTLQDFLASFRWLDARSDATGKVGVTGFCYGGGVVHWLTTQGVQIEAAVPFYGPTPAPTEAVKVKAPLLVHLAGNDDFVNPRWATYAPALKAAGVHYQAFTYAGALHGFNNDTTPRFHAAAAKEAWDRTVSFFKANLA